MRILYWIYFYLTCHYGKCAKKWKEVPSKAMEANEIQAFDINTALKSQCTLSPAKYKVKKQFQANGFGEEELVFYAARYEEVTLGVSPEPTFPDFVDSIASATCTPGSIDVVYVNPIARNCGISKVLSTLCMFDPHVHRVNRKNKVYRRLQLFYTNVAQLYNCDMLVGLQNTATPFTGGFAYLSAAQLSGLQYLTVQRYDSEKNECTGEFLDYGVNHAKNVFDRNTGLIGNEPGSGYNSMWYFCKR